jgi:predicted Abi (CAAX) family protease
LTRSEFVVARVRDGELVDTGNWVYAWFDDAGRVVYVGATGLDPRTRVWLHLHDDDPEVGRMAARFERLSDSQLTVLAMSVPEEISRADVRDALGARLADEGLLAEDAITDHLQLPLDSGAETLELAERFVARLRSSLL